MNNRLARCCVAALLTLMMVSPLWGQKTGPPQPPPQPPSQPSVPSTPSSNQPSAPRMQAPTFIYGRISTESGRPLPDSASVGLICGTRWVQVIHPDLKGNFQFVLGAGPQGNVDMSASNESSMSIGPTRLGSRSTSAGVDRSGNRPLGCELRVSAPGYQPLSKSIVNAEDIGGTDAGTLVLTPLARENGDAISVNSLLAPKKARKEFEKGEKDIRRNHLKSAARHLEKAVAEYDKYAAAWTDLGRIYLTNHQKGKARQAFSKAITADPQYIPPYLSLAELELQNGEYESVIETAGKALQLQPGMVPASFMQAAANFRLNRFDAAEKSAREAEKGPHQNIPAVHILLADILLQKHDYSDAAEQLRTYIKEAPQGKFVGEARKRLEQVEKFAANVASAPSTRGKQPQPAMRSAASSSTEKASAALRVCLRMEDDSPFLGSASVIVKPSDGPELVGSPNGSDGETTFSQLLPGTYMVEASAPGFVAIRKQTEIRSANGLRTLFLIMQPIPMPVSTAQLSAAVVAPSSAAEPSPTRWNPADIEKDVPRVEAGVECPLPQVIAGAGRRMEEFVENLQKFDATEHLEHFDVADDGSRQKPETRTFDYVAIVNHSKAGAFNIDEYRNGSLDPTQFPAHIATMGLTAMALLFHPKLVSDFNFTCEGLGQWDGHPAWQVHFAQRVDRPNRLRAYVIARSYYPVSVKGRAWIDAGTFQVRRLESELTKPIPMIALAQEYMAIDYGAVHFHTRTKQLWLPLDAEVYWARGGNRYYRRHTFSNFKIFEVESAQQIQAPKASYCFKNTSDRNVTGIFTVSPVSGTAAKPVSIRVTIAAGSDVCKLVGPGKDVNIPADSVGSATFIHDGAAGSISVDTSLVKESTLDLIPETNVAAFQP
jgi:tetratricopeptide (TPR) repeat protein